MTAAGWAKAVEDLAAAVTARYGVSLAGLDVLGEGRRTIVRVNVEGTDGAESVSVETCAKISEELSRALDLHDPVPHAYTLEVATPGLDRPLRSEGDFQRFAGRKVEVTLREPIEGRRKWRGQLVGLDAGQVVLEVDEQTARLPLERIGAARLVVEMSDLREDFSRGGRMTS